MEIKKECVNTLRLLSVEQIEKANSGHPGIALGAAPILFTLYNSVMNYNAKNPKFFNRDRFVLSAGHGSSLLYSTLHLFGFNVTMQDLKNFRQYGFNTPGHPEVGVTDGVETTTGPLGQGVANAVGMAIAEKHLKTMYNKPNFNIINNKVYCLVGDGCLMEGVSNEALSLAGHLNLDNLVVIYDSNDITLEGAKSLSFSENTKQKYEALGFKILEVEDGNNLEDLEQKLLLAKKEEEKPTLVIVKTKIGFGSNVEGTSAAHGKPLTKEQIGLLKQNLEFDHTSFTVKKEVREYVGLKQKQNEAYEASYNKLLKEYENEYLSLYEEFKKIQNGGFVFEASLKLESFKPSNDKAMRAVASDVLQELKLYLPNLIGGTADVASSTKAYLEDFGTFSKENYSGKNIYYGVREHAMASVANGISLYGGLRTFVSTYLAFTDYMKPAMRLSAIMKEPILYFITHDSILIGEDGATHQPVEQLVTLRAIPNMNVVRPCNASEVVAGFIIYLDQKNPTTLVLARHQIKAKEGNVKGALKGAYILAKEEGILDLVLIATGSEVELALHAKKELEKIKIGTRVVSMPCMELFDEQEKRYQQKVLPKNKRRIFIEAGSSYSFYKYLNEKDEVLCQDVFGASGKQQDLQEAYGFTVEHIMKLAKQILPKKDYLKRKSPK